MGARLLNVRLSLEDERVVARLKARGISISEIMRRALRAEDARVRAVAVDTDELIAEMLATHPTPAGAGRVAVDATDREAVREHIRARLRGLR